MPCMRAAPLLDSASVNRSASSSTSTPRDRKTSANAVVLLLGLGHPGQAVEQQRVVVARGQPLQLGARAVQDDDPQRADLGVGAQHGVGHTKHRNANGHLNYGLGPWRSTS